MIGIDWCLTRVLSKFPKPYIKGDAIAIKIPEEEYQAYLQRCKNHLHRHLILSNGDATIKFVDLKSKLFSKDFRTKLKRKYSRILP
ncbi:hypothetical protein Lal_00017340 [Lupinus albus]|nr:hypothetical protein Lal_00017340 [Lupinus albus]